MAGGMHGRGACMTCTPPGRYYGYGMRSMSGRYASYWNGFLPLNAFLESALFVDVNTRTIEIS